MDKIDNNKRYLVSSRSAVRYAWALMIRSKNLPNIGQNQRQFYRLIE